jgi:predicted TIM-barrel fold metal-dependent hydrolase
MLADVHQHIWTTPLLDALAERETFPFVRREHDLTVLYAAGEQPYLIDTEAESPERRAALVHSDGVDLALIALSSPIGIETLPRGAATAVISAHLDGVEALPDEFGAWGPVALDRPDPDDIDSLLTRGCAGISLPATALAGRDALTAAGPLLERAATRGAPVLIHPGGSSSRGLGVGEPLWWRALTEYVSQMQAAWLTFAALGRREHPELTIIFAMLAGGAPLLSERLGTRGGPEIDLHDPLTFYDTSSYGPVAVEGMARRVGADQLVYGSDRPVIEPVRTGRERLLADNAARLFAGVEAPAIGSAA